MTFASPPATPGTVYGLNGAALPRPERNTGGHTVQAACSADSPRISPPQQAGVNKCSLTATYSLIPSADQTNLIMNGHYEVASWLDLFTTTLYSHYRTDVTLNSLLSLSHTAYTVSASNPYNPFGTDVGIDWSYGVRDIQRLENFVRPLVGVRGAIGGGWHYEVTGLYSSDQFHIQQPLVNTAAIKNALTSSDPNTALNVFTGGAPGSQALIDSLYTNEYEYDRQSVYLGQAIVRGPLFRLPDGMVQGVFGANYQRSQLTSKRLTGQGLEAVRNAYALFTEERLPLVADESRPRKWRHAGVVRGRAVRPFR